MASHCPWCPFRLLLVDFCSPPGFLKFSVNSVQDLELLLMHNRKYAAEIAATVSSKNRKSIVQRAAERVESAKHEDLHAQRARDLLRARRREGELRPNLRDGRAGALSANTME